jgi:hypothetical protein
MSATSNCPTEVLATVTEVWPAMGLVWLEDGSRQWAVSRSTPGVDLAQLQPGARVSLAVKEVDGRLLAQAVH